MPWRIVSMKEERQKFVSEALDAHKKLTFIALCEQYNISPKTGYKWVNKFLKEGENGLNDSSRTPLTSSTKRYNANIN